MDLNDLCYDIQLNFIFIDILFLNNFLLLDVVAFLLENRTSEKQNSYVMKTKTKFGMSNIGLFVTGEGRGR